MSETFSPPARTPNTANTSGLVTTRVPILESMFSPRSIALIGATERAGSVGRTIFENLLAGGFRGSIYPVNPGRAKVLGYKAHRCIAEIPGPVDLAIIATPAPTVPDLIAGCAEAGVRGAVVISAGFKETGAEGALLERELLARRGPMRIVGPNCLGVMLPHLGLNATFAAGMAIPGSVAFLSQSGALCTAVLDWSRKEHLGFSAFLSVGSMADVGWGDLLYYLSDDPHTRSIVIYMESIGDARAFLSAAREVSLTKPIVVLKVGRSAAGAKAAASHTGSLVGDDEVLEAAFRRVGVLRVETVAELFAMAEALGKAPTPAGGRLGIVTNAGGPGGLATDMLIRGGCELAQLTPESIAALDGFLPRHWSRNNPVDILGDASPERYARAVEIVARDPNTDGTLVILTPQAMTDAVATADRLAALAPKLGKPLLTSWMGGESGQRGDELLNQAGLCTFKHPDTAARVFANLWRRAYHLRSVYETPALAPASERRPARSAAARRILEGAHKAGRTLLTEVESMRVLAAYGIPTVNPAVARSEAEAIAAAKSTSYPAVVKVHSESITHKARVGGVRLGLRNAVEVRRAYREIEQAFRKHDPSAFAGVTVERMVAADGFELILGSSTDPQFGPVLLFGAGGRLVEVMRDRSLGLPPLNATLARRMMEQTRIHSALQTAGAAGALDLGAIEQLLVRFSQLVAQEPRIKEIDINPLHVSADGLVALDARIILHDRAVADAALPRLAIRPYPIQYITRRRLRSGASVLIRPIRPEDEPRMIAFHKELSATTVQFRYFSQMTLQQRIAHDRLARICFVDYDREVVLVAEHRRPGARGREIIGVARLSKLHGRNEAEFAIVLADAWQGQGLGTMLLELLIEAGRQEKLAQITGHILTENFDMQHLCRKAGFQLKHDAAAGEMVAELVL